MYKDRIVKIIFSKTTLCSHRRVIFRDHEYEGVILSLRNQPMEIYMKQSTARIRLETVLAGFVSFIKDVV